MILESMIFSRSYKAIRHLLACIFCPCRRKEIGESYAPNRNRGYLLYIGEHSDEELREYQVNKWEARFRRIEKSFEEAVDKASSQVKIDGDLMMNEFNKMREEVRALILSETKKILKQTSQQSGRTFNPVEAVDIQGHQVNNRLFIVEGYKSDEGNER